MAGLALHQARIAIETGRQRDMFESPCLAQWKHNQNLEANKLGAPSFLMTTMAASQGRRLNEDLRNEDLRNEDLRDG
jgi:hypothetical protein